LQLERIRASITEAEFKLTMLLEQRSQLAATCKERFNVEFKELPGLLEEMKRKEELLAKQISSKLADLRSATTTRSNAR